MKNRIRHLLLLSCFLAASVAPRAQGLLGIGSGGVIGMPDTTHFGDVIQNLHVWVVNRGTTTVAGLTVNLMGVTNLLSNPFSLGTLDLTLGLLPPGDSASVPLDAFVVSPQNSNSGSNVMVIWPTAVGTTPSDSSNDEYWVDGLAGAAEAVTPLSSTYLFPNPSSGQVQIHFAQPPGPSAELAIYQGNGKLLEKRKVETTQVIDLSHLRAGVYYYQVVTDQGHTSRGKLLVQKE